jgi:hypothetical protein
MKLPPLIISSFGKIRRRIRMRPNLPYYGIARQAISAEQMKPLKRPIYPREIDVSAVIIRK